MDFLERHGGRDHETAGREIVASGDFPAELRPVVVGRPAEAEGGDVILRIVPVVPERRDTIEEEVAG